MCFLFHHMVNDETNVDLFLPPATRVLYMPLFDLVWEAQDSALPLAFHKLFAIET